MENYPPNEQQSSQLSGLSFLFSQMIRDMKFVGMFSIIYGAITSLSIIGALMGVPLIFVGVRMRDAADYFQAYQMTKDRTALINAFDAQAKFFKITKILIIVSIILMISYFIVVISLFSYMFQQAPGYDSITHLF